jgi:hypothetical protein
LEPDRPAARPPGFLAARGAEVVLFKARPLPRAKLCGGGLTPKAQRLVPDTALRTVERRVARVELRGPHFPPIHLADPAAAIAMVERSRFDLALVEAAAAEGVDVREVWRSASSSNAMTRSASRRDRCAGRPTRSSSRTASPAGSPRGLGLGGPARRQALALEVDVPFAALGPDIAVLSYRFAGGYGWYFPKGDHASVGGGSHRRSEFGRLRSDLMSFATGLGLDLGRSRVRGHWIPQGLRAGRLASRRVVLAGDAAGTADALFGECISYAILSGIAAAQTIGDWAQERLTDFTTYDARPRLDPRPARRPRPGHRALGQPGAAGYPAQRTGARAGGRCNRWSAGAVLIDRSCKLACACELHPHESTTASTPLPSMPRMHGHCRLCSVACAA